MGRDSRRRRQREGRAQKGVKTLIFCQGTRTEPDYLNALKRLERWPHMRVSAEALDPVKAVETAVVKARREDFREIYVLVDVDDTSRSELDRAAALCRKCTNKKLTFNLVVSHESFDCWLYAHVSKGRVPDQSREWFQRKLREGGHLVGPTGKALSGGFPVQRWQQATDNIIELAFGEVGINPASAMGLMLRHLATPTGH
ncbi:MULTISPECIES: RloB family protein [unclassified Corynebacterium]|uniref:RloB family protein n=1 Tax=unclassified Corynebacterium TaxID=2624378 RepID=UPI0029CA2B09|nr:MULTISPECIES: RloB family protein [unclassified Corynebacterium]WPF66202.1 RloB family protein [Corynebacterium sp. 22KM0430]WPF68693.1 RloB family protein [Corynebacterium sp. 21KM1197]